MVTVISAGSSGDFTIPTGRTGVFETTGEGLVRIKAGASGAGFDTRRVTAGAGVSLGPFGNDVVVTIIGISGSTTGSSDRLEPVLQSKATGALVGAAGVIAYPASAGDALRQSASVAPVASAISTTVAVAIAIPAQSTKVRIAWQGRGSAGAAAGTARLNIACNRENLTAGLVASQDVRRRDYQLAAGEAVVLQSATPITVLHCSANESVSANTHGIQVSYE